MATTKRSRHHPSVRLCAHSHEWIVRWLESNGWTKYRLLMPSRQQILLGNPDPGYQEMRLLKEPSLVGVYCRVPGARASKQRLSMYEWVDFMRNPDTGLEATYRLLGMDVPPARNRLR